MPLSKWLRLARRHKAVPAEHPPGTVVGGGVYRVIRKLGAGSFSNVYLVESLADGSQFALKQTLITELSEAERRSAVNELRLLASLSHPNLVQYHGGFMEGECLCVVMDLMPTGDLASVVRACSEAGRKLPEEEIWTYLLQIAAGLNHLHSHSVIHRDIKPANMLLNERRKLEVADLGVASVLTGACVRLQMGTPGFMAPELFRQECQAFPADMFSLGCVLYQLCTLKPLFAGASTKADVEKKALAWSQADALVAAAALFPTYSSELRQLLEALLQPDPAARPTAAQVLERHGTPERMACLPTPPPRNACGMSWEEAKDTPLLPAIDVPAGQSVDMQQLHRLLPAACSHRPKTAMKAGPEAVPGTIGLARAGEE